MARGLVTERIFSLVAFECFSAESKKKKEEYPFLHHGSSTIEAGIYNVLFSCCAL
jgi:hypothetical protein